MLVKKLTALAALVFFFILLLNLPKKSREIQINPVPPRNDLTLPDLKLTKPSQLYIDDKTGIKKLRFDTVSFNAGEAELRILGETNADRTKTKATQIVKRVDGGEEHVLVGEFVFHPEHDHWHIENYTQFRLWSLDEEGEPSVLLASTDKMSFCIWDEKVYEENIPEVAASRTFPECSKKTEGVEIQGNSVGWGDVYAATFEGQELDISAIPDGTYLVESSINVEKKILEKDYENNRETLYIEIEGNAVKTVETNL